jgi:hypothetical protein
MKTPIILIMLLISAIWCVAQIQIPDTTTPHTTYQTNTYYATVAGQFTNQPMTVWRSTVTYGDSLPVAFAKLSNNDLYLQTNAVSGGNSFGQPVLSTLFYTNGVLNGTNRWGVYTNFSSFSATGNVTNLMSFDGTNYQSYFYTNIVVGYTNYVVTTNTFGTNSVFLTNQQVGVTFAPIWLATWANSITSSVTIQGLTWQPQTAIFNVFTNFSTPPANTNTPVGWVAIQLSGATNLVKVPLYQ